MPNMISIIVCELQTTMLIAVAGSVAMPYIERAKIMHTFQGPRPPLLGTAIPIEESTNATRQGSSPKAVPGAVISEYVQGNAKNAK